MKNQQDNNFLVDNKLMKDFLQPYRQPPRSGLFHTHVGMMDICKGTFNLGKQQIKELFELHCEETFNNPNYLSGLAEKPQNYSMLRADIDNKELTTSDTPYTLYSAENCLDIIQKIQQYLKENIIDCKNKYLDCALLTKEPYISDTDKGRYNKHGYHLQFINCFLNKEDNSRLAEYFHSIDKKYDKIYNHPWLLYGSQKTKTTGKYKVSTIIKADGQHINPKEYFKTYKIYDYRERQIKFTKPIDWYYPRIFSIIPYNRLTTCEFKPIIDNFNKETKEVDFFRQRDNYEDVQQYDCEIIEIINNYIQKELNDALEIKESTDRGYKLRNKPTRNSSFTCPIDPNETHSRLGAFININDGAIYFGCYKCKDENNRCTKFIGRFRESKESKENNHDFEKIMAIPKEDRTKDESLYLQKIFEKIEKQNIDYLTKTTYIQSKKYDDNYVDYKIISTKKVDIIKACLGSGKSFAVNNYIKNNKFENIAVLTPRRTYARSAVTRLKQETDRDFVCYLDKKGKILNDPYIVIQAESLHKLELNIGSKLLVIDEVEAFLSQLTSVGTHKNNHIKNINTFIELVKQSDKIICLDAFISNRSLKVLSTLCGKNNIVFSEYTRKPNQRKAIEIGDVDKFMNALVNDLEKDKKIFLFSTSNTKLCKKKIKQYKIRKDGTKKDDKIINALLPLIREKYPNKVVLEFHANRCSFQLEDVNKQWKHADIVACTSTITIGNNFDLPDIFHKIYLFASASSKNLVRDMFQASYRVRHLIDNEMVYCLDENKYGISADTSTNPKEIQNRLVDRNDNLINFYLSGNYYFKGEQTPEFVKFLCVFNQMERNISIMNMRNLFDKYLELCNYVMQYDTDIDVSEVEFDGFVEPNIPYNDIPSITHSECKQLCMKKQKEPLTELESLKVEKYQFQLYLLNTKDDDGVEEPLWKIYTNFGRGKFRNISQEKGIDVGTLTIQNIIDKETNGNYIHLNTGQSMKMEVIKQIRNWCGMKNSQEVGYSIDKEKLDSIVEKFQTNRKKIHLAFDMKDRANDTLNIKSTIQLINKILDRWGFTSIKRQKIRKMTKGIKSETSTYVLEMKKDIDVASYIKPASTHKEDEQLHPLLLSKEDKKIITDEELEQIRLNTL